MKDIYCYLYIHRSPKYLLIWNNIAHIKSIPKTGHMLDPAGQYQESGYQFWNTVPVIFILVVLTIVITNIH